MSLSEKNSSFDVNAGWVVVWIEDMVWAGSLLGNSTGGAGLELSVFYDSEVNVAQLRLVNHTPIPWPIR